MAGERALFAMSTMMRNAKRGSCSIVSLGTNSDIGSQIVGIDGAIAVANTKQGIAPSHKIPYLRHQLDHYVRTLCNRHQVGLIKRQHDARSTKVLDDGSLTLGGGSPPRLLFGRIKSLGIDALHNSTSFVRDALEHGNRPQRSSHPLHKPEEDDNARQVAEDCKSDRQLRRRVFNSSRGCDGVRVGKGKDA